LGRSNEQKAAVKFALLNQMTNASSSPTVLKLCMKKLVDKFHFKVTQIEHALPILENRYDFNFTQKYEKISNIQGTALSLTAPAYINGTSAADVHCSQFNQIRTLAD
jgi:hypothetical protein